MPEISIPLTRGYAVIVSIEDYEFLMQGKWLAQFGEGRENTHRSLGIFDSEEAAALAYNRAAYEYFGRFAKLNEVS